MTAKPRAPRKPRTRPKTQTEALAEEVEALLAAPVTITDTAAPNLFWGALTQPDYSHEEQRAERERKRFMK